MLDEAIGKLRAAGLKTDAVVKEALVMLWPASAKRNIAAQDAKPDYKSNNCVNCHSRLLESLRVGNRYLEWQFSRHQEKGVSCEKCHGGDLIRGFEAINQMPFELYLSGSVSLSRTYCPIPIHFTCRCGHYEPEERRLPRPVLLQFRKRLRAR